MRWLAGAGTGRASGLAAWVELRHRRDPAAAAALADRALAAGGDTRFAAAARSEIDLAAGEADTAVTRLRREAARPGASAWLTLTTADALLVAGRAEDAERVLETVVTTPALRRHALKRLWRIALQDDRGDDALRWLRALVALAPDYLVYASDFVALGELEDAMGDGAAAERTWRRGHELYRRNRRLHDLVDGPHDCDALDYDAVRHGVRRFPVRTPLIEPGSDVVGVVRDATEGLRSGASVVAVSESAAAIAEGRIIPLELIEPGLTARALCRFVGVGGPLRSPWGMQAAVMLAGVPRVVAGAVAGAAGKAIGRRGWFYRVAGRGTAVVDDVAACLPPFDHHVIFGPSDPVRLAAELAAALGCPAAVVDANPRTGAAVLGASHGVDSDWLARVLEDNPAGNQDEQTPVVVVVPA